MATLAFAVTWIPYWYFIVTYSLFQSDRLYMTSLGDCVAVKLLKSSFYLNYVLNPIFYSFINRRFRQNVIVLFQHMCALCCSCGILRTCSNSAVNEKKVFVESKICNKNGVQGPHTSVFVCCTNFSRPNARL